MSPHLFDDPGEVGTVGNMAETLPRDPETLLGMKIAYWEPAQTGVPIEDLANVQIGGLLDAQPEAEKTGAERRRKLFKGFGRRSSDEAVEDTNTRDEDPEAEAEVEVVEFEQTHAFEVVEDITSGWEDVPGVHLEDTDGEVEPAEEFEVSEELRGLPEAAMTPEEVAALEAGVREALHMLDGSLESEVALLADIPVDHLDEYGGVGTVRDTDSDVEPQGSESVRGVGDTEESVEDLPSFAADGGVHSTEPSELLEGEEVSDAAEVISREEEGGLESEQGGGSKDDGEDTGLRSVFEVAEARARRRGDVVRVVVDKQVWRYVPRSRIWFLRSPDGWVKANPHR